MTQGMDRPTSAPPHRVSTLLESSIPASTRVDASDIGQVKPYEATESSRRPSITFRTLGSKDTFQPSSILDNDLYKFSMQQAVLQHFPEAVVTYRYKTRTEDMKLNQAAIDWLETRIRDMESLRLAHEERDYLASYPFFTASYLSYLSNFRYKPTQHIHLSWSKTTSALMLEITGLWHETILYEVPLLALISEAYFTFVDKDWDYEGQDVIITEKVERLLRHGCKFSEFGTRRRRDYRTQDIVLANCVKTHETYKKQHQDGKGALTGTSNVHFAMKYNIRAIGTVAHEFFMGISAIDGLPRANRNALTRWHETFQGNLGIALTDTFSTQIFFADFDKQLAELYDGVRQDSGDPFTFVDNMVAHFKKLGIDPNTKTVIFSDSLDVPKAEKLHDYCQKAGIQCGFGIGTHLTNDFWKKSALAQGKHEKSKPLNIVIKMKECEGKFVVKLSDDLSKNSGEDEVVRRVKDELVDPMATFEYTFVWPSAAHNTVVVTGSFDNWSQSTPLQKDEAQNRFAATVAVPRGSERIFYKFVVDGTWTTSEVEGAQVTRDEEGNANNYIDPTPIEEEEKPLHDSAAGQTATVETAANVAAIDEMAKDQDTAVSKDVPNGTVEASTPITEVDSVPQPVLPADVVPTDNAQVKEDQEDPALFAASSNDVNEDPAFGAETEPIVIGEPTEDSQVVVTPPQPKADDLEHAVIAEPPVAAPPLSIEESVEELESGKAAPDIEAINRALTPPTSPQSVVSPLKAEAVAAEPNGLPQEEFGLGKEAVPVEADTTTQAEPVTSAAEPITEESVTPTAEPVAEEPAAPTAEPVAEESVAPIAEPVAEEPAAPIAEPVAEEPVAPIAEPVAEESVAPTAEPVTEVPSLKDVAPEVVTVGAGLVPQQAVIDTATAAPRTQPELEVEEPVVPETESSADATVPLTSQIEQIEADKVEDAAISAAVAADEVAAPVPKEEGLFERAKEAAAEPEPESADIPADASVPESLAVGQSRDTATDIKDAEFEAPKEEATPAETTAEPAQASLETGQPQPEKAIVDTAEEPTQAPELPKQDAPVPQETPVVDAPAADTKGETDAPAEVQAQPTEQAAVSQPASQQEQSEPAQTKEKEQKKGKFLKRIKSLFKGE